VILLVSESVAKILADIIEADYEEVNPETELTNDNGIERIDVAKLMIECEKKYKITIFDEDVHTFKCVGDIAKYIEEILSEDAKSAVSSDEEREGWYYK